MANAQKSRYLQIMLLSFLNLGHLSRVSCPCFSCLRSRKRQKLSKNDQFPQEQPISTRMSNFPRSLARSCGSKQRRKTKDYGEPNITCMWVVQRLNAPISAFAVLQTLYVVVQGSRTVAYQCLKVWSHCINSKITELWSVSCSTSGAPYNTLKTGIDCIIAI